MVIWSGVGGSMATCIRTHTSGVQNGLCIHSLAVLAYVHIPRSLAEVSVYTPWHFALVDLPRFEAQVRVYTPWHFALVHISRFEAQVRVYTPWQP